MGDLKARQSMRRMLSVPNLTRTFTNKDKAPPKKNLTMDAAKLDAFSEESRPMSLRIEPKINKGDPNLEANRRLIETQMMNRLKEDVQTEGIFRRSGTAQAVDSLAEMLNNGEIKPWASDDVIDIAAAYKGFLRLQQKVNNPLFSENDFTKLGAAYKGESFVKRRVFAFRTVFKAMSPDHALHLKEFLNLMALTARHSAVNMMTARNLAIVTAPNLFPAALNPLDAFKKQQAQQDLVESLILDTMDGHFDSVFN